LYYFHSIVGVLHMVEEQWWCYVKVQVTSSFSLYFISIMDNY